MDADKALSRLCTQSVSLSLYADHLSGASIAQLAVESGRSEPWIAERIEAIRLCLEKQVRIVIADKPLLPLAA